MISYRYSKELDAAKWPSSSFTTLPVQLRKDDSLSQRASAKFQSEWNKSTPQQVVFGSQGIFGHLLSLILPECPPKMVPVFTKLFDYAFLENDILENTGEKLTPWGTLAQLPDPEQQKLRREILEEILDIDSPLIMSLAVCCQEYWAAKSNPPPIPGTFEGFIRQRMSHIAASMFGIVVRICMDIRLDQDEVKAIQHITDPIEQCMGLSNDYFSFKKEREDLRRGNGLNAVWFLMQKEGISEEEALEQVKSKILSLEKVHNDAIAEMMEKDALSAEMQRYITFLRLAHGGLHVFHTTTTRYGSVVQQKPSTWWLFILRAMTVVLSIAVVMVWTSQTGIGEIQRFIYLQSHAIESLFSQDLRG